MIKIQAPNPAITAPVTLFIHPNIAEHHKHTLPTNYEVMEKGAKLARQSAAEKA